MNVTLDVTPYSWFNYFARATWKFSNSKFNFKFQILESFYILYLKVSHVKIRFNAREFT